MIVQKLQALNFRNYKSLELFFEEEKNINLIIAKNGMGKSNLLEMFYYLSHLRAFRNAADHDLILRREKYFRLFCQYENRGIHGNVNVTYSGKKEIFLDGKKISKHSQILGKLQTVFFGSDDISIISGSPVEKRNFFDVFLSILDPDYLVALRNYGLLLKQKNAAIKSGRGDILCFFDRQLADVAFLIINKRSTLISDICVLFSDLFHQIGNFSEHAEILYHSSYGRTFSSPSELFDYISYQNRNDLQKGYCLLGPHRDGYHFVLNNTVFSKYASLGQTRLAALILKLVQAICYEKKFKTSPILLLDDVILELDREKQRLFLESICRKYQLFITLTDDKYKDFFDNQMAIKIIRVDNGTILQ